MTVRRNKRYCAVCSKPLGNTTYACYECEGEDASEHYGELSSLDSTTTDKGVTYRGGERNMAFGMLVR